MPRRAGILLHVSKQDPLSQGSRQTRAGEGASARSALPGTAATSKLDCAVGQPGSSRGRSPGPANCGARVRRAGQGSPPGAGQARARHLLRACTIHALPLAHIPWGGGREGLVIRCRLAPLAADSGLRAIKRRPGCTSLWRLRGDPGRSLGQPCPAPRPAPRGSAGGIPQRAAGALCSPCPCLSRSPAPGPPSLPHTH